MKPLSILVIDDDPAMLTLVTTVLQADGHRVRTAADGTAAARALDEEVFDLVITDVLFPGEHRIEAIMDMIRRHPATRIIAMSGGGRHHPPYYLRLVQTFGAAVVLAKPFTNQQLLAAVAQVCGG